MKFIYSAIAIIITLQIFSIITYAQQYEDVVYLKNGSIIHGLIMEQIPNESIKIKTGDGSLFVFKMDEVQKITKEEVVNKKAENKKVENNNIKPQNTKPNSETTPKAKSQNFTTSLNIGGGLTIPTGGLLSNSWLNGFHLTFSQIIPFGNYFGFKQEMEFTSFPYNGSVTGIEGGTYIMGAIKEGILVGIFKQSSKIIPFASLGFGFYYRKVSAMTIDGGNEVTFKDAFNFASINASAGFGYKFSPTIAIFSEVQINHIFQKDDPTTYMPIRIGIMLIQ